MVVGMPTLPQSYGLCPVCCPPARELWLTPQAPRCTYFLQGRCTRGGRCKFAHVPLEGDSPPADEVAAAEVASATARGVTAQPLRNSFFGRPEADVDTDGLAGDAAREASAFLHQLASEQARTPSLAPCVL